ncbi:MAG: haloacid dehalogenase [Sulfurovum sp. AS07-7]|nr:MAG: haloacid dehalogenase [Sulfurovum sp. AS07-7]
MQKIFITDLDHTLLRSDQSISSFTKDIINQITKDHLFTVATARSFHKVKEFLEDVKPNAPMILLDGTMITTSEKKIIDLKLLSKEISNAIVYEGQKFGIYPFIIGLEDNSIEELFWYPKVLNEHQKDVLKNYQNDPRLALKDPIMAMERVLKVVYFGSYEVLNPLTDHLKNIFGDVLEYKLSPEKYGGGWFLTLLHPEGDKSHAITKVLEYIDFSHNDLTVFGDSINDIEMFKLANISVAVANALDEVKQEANIILPHSNDEDGVAMYLSKLIKEI